MDITVNEKTENGKAIEGLRIDLKESMKKNLYLIIGNALDEETRRATEEIMKERANAVQQLADETRALFKKLLEEEKKSIWANELQSTISSVFNSGNGKVKTEQVPNIQSTVNLVNVDTKNNGNNHHAGVYEEKVELEILPPRDQNEIAIINTYLINMPEIKKVELVTLIDKSVFKVILREPVDFIERLTSLPQVFSAEEVPDKGQKQIKLTLSAKARIEQNHSEVNEKVSKIFKKRN